MKLEDRILIGAAIALIVSVVLLVLFAPDGSLIYAVAANAIGTVFGVLLAFRLERFVEERRESIAMLARAEDCRKVQRALVASVAHNVRTLKVWRDNPSKLGTPMIPIDWQTWESLNTRYAALVTDIGPLLRFSTFFVELRDYDLSMSGLTDMTTAAVVAGKQTDIAVAEMIERQWKKARDQAEIVIRKGKKIVVDLGESDQRKEFEVPRTHEDMAFARVEIQV